MRIAQAREKAQSRAAMIDIVVIVGTFTVLFVVGMAITSVAVE
jgi:divalent metal cation (Fe/Co/Zn/Cd) transporter